MSKENTEKQELMKNLNESMSKVQEWVESTEKFAVEQAPLIVDEIVAWGITKYSIYITIGFIMLCLGITSLVVAKKFYNKSNDPDRPIFISQPKKYGYKIDSEDCQLLTLLSSGAGFVTSSISFMAIVLNVVNLLYIVVAPRLYIIEEIKNFVS